MPERSRIIGNIVEVYARVGQLLRFAVETASGTVQITEPVKVRALLPDGIKIGRDRFLDWEEVSHRNPYPVSSLSTPQFFSPHQRRRGRRSH